MLLLRGRAATVDRGDTRLHGYRGDLQLRRFRRSNGSDGYGRRFYGSLGTGGTGDPRMFRFAGDPYTIGMSDLKYEDVERLPKEELITRLASAKPFVVACALYSATRWDPDWRWVQEICLERLASPHVPIRWAAATCLGDLAFYRRPLDCDIVIPALTAATADATISDPAAFSLSMVKQFVCSQTK